MKLFNVRYVRGKNINSEGYTHYGMKFEILYRGFSKREILIIEQNIRLKIQSEIAKTRKSKQVCEVTLNKFDTKPFKDELNI